MYSKELIKKVKDCYPNDNRIHELADSGNAFLGRFLDDNCDSGIPINTVLNATTLKELKDVALLEKRKIDCYRLWCNEYLGNQ